ncbi:MAG: Mov34/MPN/PAD-1 family protein [Candidatus Dormibacteraeota bacterium]|nr:Mov34/MPN/PAD-1 family protein [Candidatus Dormibacteraeota bacterium]
MARILLHCERARKVETGGILIGRYSKLGDQAFVTAVTGPPTDSVATRQSFVRGIRGLQRHISRAWLRREFYLGEWHFHPMAAPYPSRRDLAQIKTFALDPDYACPEPILIVIGGDPMSRWDMWAGVVMGGGIRRLRPWIPNAQ